MANNDKVYEAYYGSMGENFQKATRNRIDWIISQCDNAKTVLDIGCSQGIVTLMLARLGKKCIGVDIEEEAIDFANDKLKNEYSDVEGNVEFFCSDFMEFESEDKFDCIVVTEVIEHLKTPCNILKRASEMLADGGKMVITTPFGVCEHPDHYATYYASNFEKVLQQLFTIQYVEFVEQWIGAVCLKKIEVLDDRVSDIFEREEEAFEKKERKYIEINKGLHDKLKNANQKYRESTENYSILKKKNNEISEKLQEVNKDYLDIKLKNDELSEKLQEVNKDYLDIKLKNDELNEELQEANKKYHQETLEYAKLEEKCGQYKDVVERYEFQKKKIINESLKCFSDYETMINQTEQLQKRIIRLENQNSTLIMENAEQKKKLDIINNSKIGKLGIKAYKFYKKYMRK